MLSINTCSPLPRLVIFPLMQSVQHPQCWQQNKNNLQVAYLVTIQLVSIFLFSFPLHSSKSVCKKTLPGSITPFFPLLPMQQDCHGDTLGHLYSQNATLLICNSCAVGL